MAKDTLELRYADLVTNKQISNKSLELGIEATLPMMITKSTYLAELTIVEEAGPAITDEDFDISDPEYLADKGEERYVILTVAKSPLTNNRAVFYYDKLFNDIIVLPNIAFLDMFEANFHYRLRGFRIGSGCMIDRNNPHQVLPNHKGSAVRLPAVKGKITNKTLLARVPGMVPEHLVRNDTIEEMIDKTNMINLIRTTVQPSCIINLGKASAIFDTVGKLPLYLLAQSSLKEYTLEYLTNIDPKDNDILISLYF